MDIVCSMCGRPDDYGRRVGAWCLDEECNGHLVSAKKLKKLKKPRERGRLSRSLYRHKRLMLRMWQRGADLCQGSDGCAIRYEIALDEWREYRIVRRERRTMWKHERARMRETDYDFEDDMKVIEEIFGG